MRKKFWLEKTKECGHFEGPDVGVWMKWIINKYDVKFVDRILVEDSWRCG